ncbi:MAG: Ig-like domain-containing protein, partial [Chlorobiaceae bacterium]
TQVTFNKNIVTINPTADLHAGHHYHVTIASDAIKDVAGNAYTGISDATTLDFTTIVNPAHDLTENVTFWKTGAAISDVATTITSVPTGGTHPIALKNIHIAADGSHVVEVWATTPNSTTGSMELEFALPTGSSATWQSAANLPVGWTSAANTVATSGHLLVGGMSANPLAEGQVKLGTLTITMPTNPDNLELLLVGGQLGDNDIEGFGISSISSNTGSGNEYIYHSLNDGNYNLAVDKLAGAREASAVHANDALAALKMSVAINPNSDGSGVLPYQFLAADINQDGRVRANDAFNILKMAVGLDTAPEDKWIFVSEDEALAATMSRTAVDWSVADINVLHNADTQLHLIGIVKGDVDGSWVA